MGITASSQISNQPLFAARIQDPPCIAAPPIIGGPQPKVRVAGLPKAPGRAVTSLRARQPRPAMLLRYVRLGIRLRPRLRLTLETTLLSCLGMGMCEPHPSLIDVQYATASICFFCFVLLLTPFLLVLRRAASAHRTHCNNHVLLFIVDSLRSKRAAPLPSQARACIESIDNSA